MHIQTKEQKKKRTKLKKTLTPGIYSILSSIFLLDVAQPRFVTCWCIFDVLVVLFVCSQLHEIYTRKPGHD
jgi:hypothetical protein